MIDEQNWYARFLELIMGLEAELGIEFTDDDFPAPFVTWRHLLTLTKERCGRSVLEEDIIIVVAKLSFRPVNFIRNELDQAIS
ncbi:hypothetical protein F0L74_12890 [Chitinophaga agrisoli]|uniref:Uncharacterized protein n=1 Tax=Chitinophaga agrisoli TaxID=2607653 RepID=A0A5B2VYI4_9BACT|nr:hypothetical protein [Chitinophaga agrisoli]KAA2243392.1 hypothetical protein F0L74_12890 [Chitinophaga agrisoli]